MANILDPMVAHRTRGDTDGLKHIRIEGFGSLRDVALRPGPLTVLIGANGSGKSNLLKALRMVALMRAGALQRFVGEAAGGAASLLHYGPKHTQAISVQLDFEQSGSCSRYVARLGYAAGDRLIFLDESVGYGPSNQQDLEMTSLGGGHWESLLRDRAGADPIARTLNDWLAQLTFFHFHDTSLTSALRTHARVEDDQSLRADGSNLAAFLARLRCSDDEAEQKAWWRIGQLVRRVAPVVRELLPTLTNAGSVRLDWTDDRDARFGAHQLSDGTLRAIALITALAQPTEQLPGFISIDEPELGLHPAAIGLLAELARSVAHRTQVLFATQSTAFLDHFEPDEVVVVERDAAQTRLHRPDPRTLDAWLDDYSLADIFNKGVIGGRP